jgi:hypothetical protein
MVRQEKVRVALGTHLSVTILLTHTVEHSSMLCLNNRQANCLYELFYQTTWGLN